MWLGCMCSIQVLLNSLQPQELQLAADVFNQHFGMYIFIKNYYSS